jgi:hypothetical protein
MKMYIGGFRAKIEDLSLESKDCCLDMRLTPEDVRKKKSRREGVKLSQGIS